MNTTPTLSDLQEIAWLKTAPEKCFLYVKMPAPKYQVINRHANIVGRSFATRKEAEEAIKTLPPAYGGYQVSKLQQLTDTKVQTWLGTDVATNVVVGSQVHGGFGFHTYKRSIKCRIFGVKYFGWYHESSGNYCRLRKAKQQ